MNCSLGGKREGERNRRSGDGETAGDAYPTETRNSLRPNARRERDPLGAFHSGRDARAPGEEYVRAKTALELPGEVPVGVRGVRAVGAGTDGVVEIAAQGRMTLGNLPQGGADGAGDVDAGTFGLAGSLAVAPAQAHGTGEFLGEKVDLLT